MPLQRENRQEISKLFTCTCALRIAMSILLFAGSAAHSPAQLPKSAASTSAKTEPPPPTDPLGRETPRSALVGFLKYAEREDFTTAARYLQPTQDTDLVQCVRQLRALRSRFEGDIDLLSDEPNGSVEAGLPTGEARAGVLKVGATSVDVILVRVDDPDSGKIWLISKDTVARIPGLYAQMKSEGPTTAERLVPAALANRHLLDMSLAQWLGWLLSIPISWFLAWLLEFLLSAPHRIWCKLRKLPLAIPGLEDAAEIMPLRCIICDLGAWLFRLPASPTALVSRLPRSLFGRPPCRVFRVVRVPDNGPGLRPCSQPDANTAEQAEEVDPGRAAAAHPPLGTVNWLCRSIGHY